MKADLMWPLLAVFGGKKVFFKKNENRSEGKVKNTKKKIVEK